MFQKKAPVEATEKNEPMPAKKGAPVKKGKGKPQPEWAGVANSMLGKSC